MYSEPKQKQPNIEGLIEHEYDEIQIIHEAQKLIVEPATNEYNISTFKSNITFSGKELDQYLKGDLRGLGKQFVKAGEENGIDPVFLAALAAQETGWGESKLMESPWNNVGGMICMPENYEAVFGESYENPGCLESVPGGTKWQKFLSVEDSIYFKAAYLKMFYLENGRKTISEIQEKYAPYNASNDQTGLNDYWTENIVKIMNDVKDELHS